jgi:ABC-type branched-subunit amino acid transport system substrate-binding protein
MIIIIFTCSIVINLSIKSANGFANDIKNIYFGQTIDLDNNQVASEYFKGFHLAFQSINRIGGIDGYKINIILLNDKYDKELAVKNAILLTDYYNVLALIGLFGTTTITNVIESVVNNKNIPLIAPFSGSTVIKKNFTKNLILTNGSNNQEFKLLFDLLRKKKIKNIGIIYQNDDYGYSYLNNFINQIMIFKEELNILSAASYERNSINLYSTYIKLFNLSSPYLENYKDKNNKLEAVILFCTETQISNILATLKKINPSLLIYYGFFTGNNKLNYKVVGNNTENVYQSLLSYNIEKFPILYKKFIEEVEYYNNFGKGDQITNIKNLLAMIITYSTSSN